MVVKGSGQGPRSLKGGLSRKRIAGKGGTKNRGGFSERNTGPSSAKERPGKPERGPAENKAGSLGGGYGLRRGKGFVGAWRVQKTGGFCRILLIWSGGIYSAGIARVCIENKDGGHAGWGHQINWK